MSLICKDDETLRRTSVRKLKPLAFNLNLIQQLSELSWLPVDNNVSIAEMEQAFRSMVRTKDFPLDGPAPGQRGQRRLLPPV